MSGAGRRKAAAPRSLAKPKHLFLDEGYRWKRVKNFYMHALVRAMALAATLSDASACATTSHASLAAQNEYKWALLHGFCECGPIAYAKGSVVPSWVLRQTFPGYVREKSMGCASREFVVVAFGDGGPDVAGDLGLARARAAPFVRRLDEVKGRRVDTLVFAGPHIAHPATLEIFCPTARLPAQDTF